MAEKAVYKFADGDLVSLKGGGPIMTIMEQNALMDALNDVKNKSYRCQWFAGKKLEAATFPETSLVAVDRDGKTIE